VQKSTFLGFKKSLETLKSKFLGFLVFYLLCN